MKDFFPERDPLDISAADIAQLQESQNIEFVVEDDDQDGKYFKILVIKKTFRIPGHQQKKRGGILLRCRFCIISVNRVYLF